MALGGRQPVLRGAAIDWPSIQAVRRRMAATQSQPEGPLLRAPGAASSLGRGCLSTSSLFLAPNARKSGAACLGFDERPWWWQRNAACAQKNPATGGLSSAIRACHAHPAGADQPIDLARPQLRARRQHLIRARRSQGRFWHGAVRLCGIRKPPRQRAAAAAMKPAPQIPTSGPLPPDVPHPAAALDFASRSQVSTTVSGFSDTDSMPCCISHSARSG